MCSRIPAVLLIFALPIIVLALKDGITGQSKNRSEGMSQQATQMISAKIEADGIVDILFDGTIHKLRRTDIVVKPPVTVQEVKALGKNLRVVTESFDLTKSYTVRVRGFGWCELQPDGILDSYRTRKELGCTFDGYRTIWCLFSPRSKKVTLVLFDTHDQEQGQEYEMMRDIDGVWEHLLPETYFGKYYAYRIDGPKSPTEMFNPNVLIADPYSKAVVSRNNYLHQGRTLIIDTRDYDWEGDAWLEYDWEDLIIYECHMRDMTAHPSSGWSQELRGNYLGFIEQDIRGGINHIKSLGVNAVEFLPLQDFGNIEIPYQDSVGTLFNNWNPYERNHWGYMTSYFFAPESYYATDGNLAPSGYCGVDGRAIKEFKDVVKALHKEGIAVLMDVVYNHVSEYDQNCLKYTDKKYYFRIDEKQNFKADSYCGNDFKTERPMVRRLIVESIKYWMTEYHVDGFRFDLAAMIDWETVEEIIAEARRINPKVIIIAEPWGGGKYSLDGFSKRGWAAWNDQFRNGVKGQNPRDGHGFIFGKWQGANNIETMKRYVLGSIETHGGSFVKSAHSVNYLESHDDHTFGDFIRIGNGDVGEDEVITGLEANAKLTAQQMKLNKLGALFLFTSQGPAMIHEGQEFARSKVIAATDVPDENIGKIDHNSYNKDNETNWLNYAHADLNVELVDYYKRLVELRKAHPAFRRSRAEDIAFLETKTDFAFGYHIDKSGSNDVNDFVVLLNGNSEKPAKFELPKGKWTVVVDGAKAGEATPPEIKKEEVEVPPTTGMILKK